MAALRASWFRFIIPFFLLCSPSSSHRLAFTSFKEGADLANDWSQIGQWMEKVVWRQKDSLIQLMRTAAASGDITNQCSRALRTWIDALSEHRLWAFQMLDSSASGDAGFIDRFVDFGDYDLCLSVSAPADEFHGQHCLARLEFALPPPHRKDQTPHVDISNTSMQGSWLEKCAHNYKYLYFEKLTTGICFPSACQPKEVEKLLNSELETRVPARVVLPDDCDTRFSRPFDFWEQPLHKKMAMFALASLFFLTVFSRPLSTVSSDSLNAVLSHFDMAVNSAKLFVDTSDPVAKRLAWIHGARTFYLMLAIGFHCVMGAVWTASAHVKFANSKPVDFPLLNEFSANMTVGISVNFVIGGMLAFVSWFPELRSTKGRLSFVKYVIGRWLRTFPLIAGVMLVILAVPDSFGSGPLWMQGFTRITNNCLNNWWAEFAYVSNHIDFRDSCLMHAWYLGADFQLYFFAFPIIILMFQRPRVGLTVVAVVITCSVLFQASYLYANELHPICDYNTTDFDRLFQKEALLHSRAFNYIPCYLIGIVLGFLILNEYKIENKVVQMLGWLVFVSLGVLVHVIPMAWKSSGRSNRTEEIIFGSLQRTMYSLAYAYGFFVGSYGEAGVINSVLESRFFVPIGRASFSVFIGHFLIIWWDVFTTRTLFEFRIFNILTRFIYTSILSLFIGYWIYILFEAPFLSFGKSIAGPKPKSAARTPKKD